MNSGSFNKMKKTPIIINSSRGSIINENDLLKAYKEKLIGGFDFSKLIRQLNIVSNFRNLDIMK